MNNSPLNLNALKKGVSFKGNVTPDTNTLKAAKRFINCGLNGLEKSLLTSVDEKAPELIKNVDGQKYILDDNISRKFSSGLKSFFSMPLDIIDAIGKKFPNSKLNNAQFLQNYRKSMQFEDEIRALQGLQKRGMEYAQEVLPQKNYPTGECDVFCQTSCDKVTDKFNKLLNSSMADEKAVYDTKKERFWARIVSGFTAALFLGNDFYNKSIQKGKTEKEAKKEQHLKQGQEIKENICEAVTQFAIFACFSKTVNKSIWGSAVIGALIGLASRIISRLSSNMPIRRIKAPLENKKSIVSLNEFKTASKEGKIQELKNKKQSLNPEEKTKKPLLCAKNILLFCLFSILGGYSLRFLKGQTKIGKAIAKKLQGHNEKFNSETIEEVFADKDKLKKLRKIVGVYDNELLSENIRKAINSETSNKVSIGTDYKTKKLFGRIEVKVKDLKRLKTAPFRFIKELVSYPYKIASKLESAIKNAGKKGAGKANTDELITDKYKIKNLYQRFVEFEAKYGNDEAKLEEEFGKYLKKMRLLSNNDVTSSSCNNSKIAVVAQTLGTLTGMWFNMNDEYNSSIRNGSTKYEAQKDARLRGINKFFRMTVQLIISGSLNDIFQKQYNQSLGYSALIVAMSTILTDMASRVLSGMPSKKMTKEELDNYQIRHKEGAMSWYYKMIDKLAS